MLIRDFSGLNDFLLDLSRRLSKLFLETSGGSGRNSKVSAVPLSDALFWLLSESGAVFFESLEVGFDLPRDMTNFLRCLMNSG